MKKIRLPILFVLTAFLVGCVPFYKPPTSGDIAYLEFLGRGMWELRIHQSGSFKVAKLRSFSEMGRDIIAVPAGKEVVVNAGYQSITDHHGKPGEYYRVTCLLPIHFVPKKGVNYKVLLKVTNKSCQVDISHLYKRVSVRQFRRIFPSLSLLMMKKLLVEDLDYTRPRLQ